MKRVAIYLILIQALLFAGVASGQTVKTVGGTGANYSTLGSAFSAINAGDLTGDITLQITGNTSESSCTLVKSGQITTVLITNGGSGYVSAPTVTFSAPASGQTATGDATITGGAVTAITISFSGNGYTSAPTITITGGSGSGATATALPPATLYTSVNIYPTVSGKTISSYDRSTISFSGADNVTIDGRLYTDGVPGAEANLSITNSNSGQYWYYNALLFTNGATHNTVKYCNIKASGYQASIINFYTSASVPSGGTGSGNSYNTIDHNNITNNGSFPMNAIDSYGQTSAYNSFNTISNNNIFNLHYFSTQWTYLNCNYINIAGYSTDWTISGNSFYETASFVPASNAGYTAINISTSGSNFTISNNYIGGSAPKCGGTPLTKTASDNLFTGIYLSVGTASASSIQGNTIQNISWTNTGAALFYGINVAGGAVDVGTTTGNTIGASTGTGSITYTAAATGGTFYGINVASTGTTNTQNNTVGSVTVANEATLAGNFYGINKTATAGSTTISNNTIGSTVTAGSINASSASTSNAQTVYGISCAGTGAVTISGNTISKLVNGTTNTTTATLGLINGICVTAGTNSITGNTVRDLTIANANNSSYETASVAGIVFNNTAALAQTISGNTLYNLSNTLSTFIGSIYGLYYNGGATECTVAKNFIHDLSVHSSSVEAYLNGIKQYAGAAYLSNNLILLGGNTKSRVYGIQSNSTPLKLYFNTVYISGSSASTSYSSYAMYSSGTTNPRDFRNNIFFNARSASGGSNLNYAVYISSGGTLTCDYNDYFVSGTAGTLGYYNSTNKTALPIVTGATDNDANSQALNPSFANIAGTTAASFQAGTALTGLSGTGITTDYAGNTRIVPQMGAFEYLKSTPVVVSATEGTSGAGYATLKDAFDALNAGTHNGDITIKLMGSTTETASAVLNASGSGGASYTSVNIYPTESGFSITGNLEAPLIDLNGADNVTIDGRVNATGATIDLIISNTNISATSGTSTIRLINDSKNNTIKNCNLKGSTTSPVDGIVTFSTGTTDGNDSNTIDNNNITGATDASRPINALFSLGTTGKENSGNTISNNNIYNFLNRGIASFGINLGSNSTAWTLSVNSFYETASFVPTASVEYNVIYINNTTGNNHTITGNYIGGSSAGCGTGGVATGWTKTNAFDNAFTAISLSTGTGTASSIQGNTIAKFTWSNSSNAAWYGMNIGGGDVNTGTVTGNTIGAATGTASILLTGASTGENFYGIQLASTGTTNTQNNIIGAVTVANGATLASNFYGITKTATAGTTTISNNTIGSTITAGSINASSASSGYAQTVNGISSEGTGTVTISGNTIANLTNGTTNATAGNLIGLYVNGGTTGTVSSNFIYSLTADASSTATSVYGIKAGTGATTYSNNIITLGGNTATTMYGIYESGTSGNNNSLYFNTIYIGGSPAAGVTNKSYVLYSASNANSRDFRNNIFFNARSTTGGSNLHYAAWFNYGNAGSLTLGNNNYNTTGAGTVPGYYNSANVNSLPLISTLDIGSIPGNPLFASPGGTLSANYIPSNNYLLAATGTGQATDYAGTTRSSTLPAMGAYEITVVNSSLVTVNATAGTATAGYSSLKSAFDAINAGTHKGNVTVIINGNITELQSAVLNASGTGNASYITTTIYPSVSGLSITGNMEAPLIDLNGADKVTIDGRVNATGSTSDLIIINTNTSATSGTSSIRLINDAKNNTVKYCNLKGSSTSSVDGIILFSTGTTDGNDGNTITNNNITGATDASRPINALFSLGTTGKENSGNTISNNNIYNFLNRGIASFGINLGSNSTAWTLSVNSFYETASFVPTASVEYNVIYITNTTGNNHTISGNYIGGSSAGCGTGGVSTGWTKTNAFDNAFTAINLSLGTGTASNIQGNTIAKFTWSNSSNASWYGMNIGGGDVNTGTVTGNTIGAATGTGSILLTGASTGETFYGINIASSGTTNTQNNTIGAVTVANGATLAGNIYGITKTATAGITTISNNTIGNATNANSIYAYSKSTGNPQLVYGINSAGTGAITISGNTIANLTNGINANNVSNGIINGIYVSAGTNSITGNTVHDLLIYTSNSSVLYQTAVGGIVFNNTTAAAQLISGNSIYNLNSPYYGNINGIYYNGGTTPSKVSENAIYNYITSTNEKTLYGINIRAGSATYVNNVISIIPTGYHTIYGIYESGAAGNDNNLIFNTVYIGGTPTSGPRNSYALYSALTTNTRNFRNNIFYNARSSNGTHYAAYFATSGATGLTEDYNDYYAPGTGGILGFFNNANVTTLAAWKTATGKDVNSFNSNPIFALTGGSMAGDYSPGTILAGTSISDITTDYLGLARSASAPSMGAFENQSCNVLVLATAGTATGGYATLKGAFDAINTGTHQGVITLKILNSTTETAAAVLNASGSGAASYTSALIYPVLTGLSVTGNFATPLIDLNGADNVTFDGRVNATGTNKDLLISNTSTAATTGTSTIRFINDATTNTVKYCNLKGSTTDYNAGIVFFSTAGAGNGNDGSTFDNNNITSTTNASRPINTICSIGTGSKENSNNTISNNFIYNFLNKGTGSNGISIGSNNTAWTISDNSFYETASFVPNNYASYTVIYISSGINHTISGNYIGGSSSGCGTGGSVTVWTKTWAN